MKRLTLTDRVENIELHLPWLETFPLCVQWNALSFTGAAHFIPYRAMGCSFIYRRGTFFPIAGNGALFHLPLRLFFYLKGK